MIDLPMLKLVLLDRDGVINHDSENYVKTPDEWTLIPGSAAAIGTLNKAGLIVAICSNQSGIGRGILTDSALELIHRKMHDALREAGAHIDRVYVCPHHPDDDCECRKPRPGMLIRAMNEFGASPDQTCFVGDSLRDIEAAIAAGCYPILVRTGNGRRDEAAARALGARRLYGTLHDAVQDLCD